MAKGNNPSRNSGSGSSNARKTSDDILELLLKSLAAKASGGLIGGMKAAGGAAASGAKGAGASAISALVGGLTGLAAKLAAVAGPLALLGLAVSSATSGVTVFFTTMKLVGTVLGGFLAPIFITLAGIVYGVITTFQGDFIRAIKSWSSFILTNAVKAIDFLDKALFGLAEAAVQTALGMINAANSLVRSLNKVLLPLGIATGANLTVNTAGLSAGSIQLSEQLANIQAARKGLNTTKDEFGSGFKSLNEGDFSKNSQVGMQMALDEMRRSMGPQAQSMGLADVSRNAQLAALNASPFESKMIEIQQQVLQVLQESLNESRSKKPAVE